MRAGRTSSHGLSLFSGRDHFTPLFMGGDHAPGSAGRPRKGSSLSGTGDLDASGDGLLSDGEEAVVVTDVNINSVLDNPRVSGCWHSVNTLPHD